MKENRFARVLREGRAPVGHMVMEFATRGIAPILAAADLDFVVIDMEHTGFDAERIADLMLWFRSTDVAPFVRVPQTLYHFLARTMDAGALGVMAANVESAAQARSIVDAVKYAPMGKRGVCLGTAHNDYRMPDPAEYFRYANRNTTVICQIESVAGVENVEAIAATEGVDVVWVGHYDLSQSQGIVGQFDRPEFQDALRRVVAAAEQHGKHAAIQPGSRAQAEEWLSLGFHFLSWGADIGVYKAALTQQVQECRALYESAARPQAAGVTVKR